MLFSDLINSHSHVSVTVPMGPCCFCHTKAHSLLSHGSCKLFSFIYFITNYIVSSLLDRYS